MKESIASDIIFLNESRELGYEVENCQSLNNSTGAFNYLHTRVSISSSIGSDEHYTITEAFQQYDYNRCLWVENCMQMLDAVDNNSNQ